MLRKLRIVLAVTVSTLVTLLFLDFTGMLHLWFGWLAKTQLIPAILENETALIIIVLLTIIFGRVYCSVICPLGVMQDAYSNIADRRKKNRFRYSKAINWLRYGVLALFIAASAAGLSIIFSLFDPYAAYGRIASSLFAPLYRLGNNFMTFFAERAGSYAFYSTDVWIKGWIVFGIALATFIVLGILAWRNGRTYCNTICPVGTILGFISKYSLFKLTVNADKCNGCELCARNCKASCLNSKENKIDYSRCVNCFNCIEKCKSGAISYSFQMPFKKKNIEADTVSNENNGGLSRRNLLSLLGMLAATQTLKAQQQVPLLNVDGGLTPLEAKKAPKRQTHIAPPGAESLEHIHQHCTACQLCISACPNNVLRPSMKLSTLMQPEMSFEKGYCRPECVECSSVCPTGAIKRITVPEKSVISIGQAVWVEESCIVNRDKVQCNVCEVKCPAQAIVMRRLEPENRNSPPPLPPSGQMPPFSMRPVILKVPVVDKEKCIGCGACEHLCPVRPLSAIYVEGNERHREIW